MAITLRFRGPAGTVRIQVEATDTFAKLGEKLQQVLPDNVDYNTLTLSNAPAGGDSKRLVDILPHKVSKIGVR
jgi:nuclear protein localization protein 4 homolog